MLAFIASENVCACARARVCVCLCMCVCVWSPLIQKDPRITEELFTI